MLVHRTCSTVSHVWWTHQQSHLPPLDRASCCTWGTVYCVPVRLSSRQWRSSADRRRWAGPRACVGPGGGAPQWLYVLPLCTLSHSQAPAGDNKTSIFTQISQRLLLLKTAILNIMSLKHDAVVSPVSYRQSKGCHQWTLCLVKH